MWWHKCGDGKLKNCELSPSIIIDVCKCLKCVQPSNMTYIEFLSDLVYPLGPGNECIMKCIMKAGASE